MRNLQCPYCGKKVSYISAFLEKSEGEHTCKKCGRNSTIYFRKAIRGAILATILIAVGILIAWLLVGKKDQLWGMLWVLIPFIIFYLCTPLFFRLVPLKVHTAGQTDKKITKKRIYRPTVPTAASGSTRVMPRVSNIGGEYIFLDEEKMEDTSTKIIPTIKENQEEEYLDISSYTDRKL
ncbi:MAG: hypothetical protein U0M23_00100 [Acutalibacteraceae bacterium]|nr:hypothetical protein [Acutalibacteraceae bacterium]HIR03797.1 hypothetical protein [Candidatus Scatovicinus merdipullorum]